MDNFTIYNTSTVKSLCEELINNGTNINSTIEELNEISNSVFANWEETQADAQAFKTRLLNEIDFSNRSISTNNNFANSMRNYIEFIEKTSSTNATSGGI